MQVTGIMKTESTSSCSTITSAFLSLNIVRSVLLYLLIGMSICGCDTSNTPSTEEIQAGEPDYPVTNPNPTQKIQFIAIIPSTLSANFDYGYEASSSDMSCKRELGGGVMASFGYDKPLTLEQSGSRFQTIFVIDQFKPGRCGWKFIGFGAQVVKPGFSSIALTKYDAETSTPEAIHLDVWCASRNNRPMGGCNDLSFLAFDKNIPASFIATLSSAQLQARFPVRFGASTKSTTVEFHDIDDQIGDRPQPRK